MGQCRPVELGMLWRFSFSLLVHHHHHQQLLVQAPHCCNEIPSLGIITTIDYTIYIYISLHMTSSAMIHCKSISREVGILPQKKTFRSLTNQATQDMEMDYFVENKHHQEGRACMVVPAPTVVLSFSLSACLKFSWVGTRYSSSPWTGFLRTKPLSVAHFLARSTIILGSIKNCMEYKKCPTTS